jgi:hypothetical protein
MPVDVEVESELRLVERLSTRLPVVLTPVDNELTEIDNEETVEEMELTDVDVLPESEVHAVDTELIPDDRLVDAVFQPVET